MIAISLHRAPLCSACMFQRIAVKKGLFLLASAALGTLSKDWTQRTAALNSHKGSNLLANMASLFPLCISTADKPRTTGLQVVVGGSLLLALLFVCLQASKVTHLTPNVAIGGFVLVLAMLLLLPMHSCVRDSSSFLLNTLSRVLWPSDVSFAEVLVADGLTSISKIFSDVGVMCLLLMSSWLFGGAALPPALRSFVAASLACIPAMLRVRQCEALRRVEPDPYRRRLHSLNIGKYASSFPVIWLSALQALRPHSLAHWPLGSLAVAAAVVNTLYCLCWDVVMDWGLGQGGVKRGRRLRNVLLLGAVWPYYAAIGADALLRCSWIVPALAAARGGSEAATAAAAAAASAGAASLALTDTTLVLELVEVLRRSMWGVLRLEWEVVQQAAADTEKQRIMMVNV
jgi:EXS family